MAAGSNPLRDHPRYDFVKPLGSGAFGQVVCAYDKHMEREVAIKLLNRGTTITDYVETELLNHRLLWHPHIIRFLETFLTNQHLCIVLEYAQQGDLFSFVVKHKSLDEKLARWLFQQHIIALDYLHRQKLCARDVKLENTLVAGKNSRDPLIKICDLGYSKHTEEQSIAHTQVGTPGYMSPEVLSTGRNGGYDGCMADIWSSGVMLYTMLRGRYPFERLTDAKLPVMLKNQKIVDRILVVDVEYPETLSQGATDLLKRMLTKDPSKRINIAGIVQHPWFTAKLPSGVLTMNEPLLQQQIPKDQLQSHAKALHRMVVEARRRMPYNTAPVPYIPLPTPQPLSLVQRPIPNHSHAMAVPPPGIAGGETQSDHSRLVQNASPTAAATATAALMGTSPPDRDVRVAATPKGQTAIRSPADSGSSSASEPNKVAGVTHRELTEQGPAQGPARWPQTTEQQGVAQGASQAQTHGVKPSTQPSPPAQGPLYCLRTQQVPAQQQQHYPTAGAHHPHATTVQPNHASDGNAENAMANGQQMGHIKAAANSMSSAQKGRGRNEASSKGGNAEQPADRTDERMSKRTIIQDHTVAVAAQGADGSQRKGHKAQFGVAKGVWAASVTDSASAADSDGVARGGTLQRGSYAKKMGQYEDQGEHAESKAMLRVDVARGKQQTAAYTTSTDTGSHKRGMRGKWQALKSGWRKMMGGV